MGSPKNVVNMNSHCRSLFNFSLLMTIEVLHGSHVAWQEQWKCFALERTFVPTGKIIYCSCHATWLPCKTSILYFLKSNNTPCHPRPLMSKGTLRYGNKSVPLITRRPSWVPRDRKHLFLRIETRSQTFELDARGTKSIGNFRVNVCLLFKASLSAKFLWW